MAVRSTTLALLLACLFCVSANAVLTDAPFDCTGPAGDPAPDTPAWHAREQANDWCGEQRADDTSTNPLFGTSSALTFFGSAGQKLEDPYRDPATWAPARGRYDAISFTTSSGERLNGAIFRPPASKRGPYPGVLVVHGGAANQEMYLWGSEGLAESGYMVMTFQIPEPENAQSDFHYPDAKDALNWFLGPKNPFASELDHNRIGLAGHSAGGVAVSQLGQEDPRVSAIVSWDRAQSSPMPAGLKLRTPALFFVADFNCQKVPVCVPQPYTSPPDPKGPGNKDEDFQRLRAAGIDTMKIALRAATHLDFTQFGIGTGSRYGAAVAFYYTRAWFDSYLKHQRTATKRLTATRFDRSGDVHNISGGVWDPSTNSNIPAFISGQPVRDRLSFHFRSAYYFNKGRKVCEDMRAECAR
jgi:dienelactone hydrolase